MLTIGVDVRKKNNVGMALHLAVRYGDSETAKILLAEGADVNLEDERGTPSHIAREWNHVEIVKTLLAGCRFLRPANPVAIFPPPLNSPFAFLSSDSARLRSGVTISTLGSLDPLSTRRSLSPTQSVRSVHSPSHSQSTQSTQYTQNTRSHPIYGSLGSLNIPSPLSQYTQLTRSHSVILCTLSTLIHTRALNGKTQEGGEEEQIA